MENKSPFVKAVAQETRVKLFLFGAMGLKKTRTALQFPSPVVIDMENGTNLYASEFDFGVRHTVDADEVMAAVDWLFNNKHEYKTLVIDPITIYWAALQDKYRAIFAQRKKGTAGDKIEYYEIQPSDWITIKAELRRVLRKALKLDMNLVVTAHEKKLYSDTQMMKVIGDTFDGEKGLGYVFDIVVRTFMKGDEVFARVVKDRTHKLPEGDFPLSYDIFTKCFGEQSLNRIVETIPLATIEQIAEIQSWYVKPQFAVDAPKRLKLLAEYDVDTEQDLTTEQANAVIKRFEEAHKKLTANMYKSNREKPNVD